MVAALGSLFRDPQTLEEEYVGFSGSYARGNPMKSDLTAPVGIGFHRSSQVPTPNQPHPRSMNVSVLDLEARIRPLEQTTVLMCSLGYIRQPHISEKRYPLCDLALGGLRNFDHPFMSILTLWLYAVLAHPSLDLHVRL